MRKNAQASQKLKFAPPGPLAVRKLKGAGGGASPIGGGKNEFVNFLAVR
jgi:hypothetical protein